MPGEYRFYIYNYSQEQTFSGSNGTVAVFQGGSHSIFTDRPGTGGAQLNPQVKAATRELARQFGAGGKDGLGIAQRQRDGGTCAGMFHAPEVVHTGTYTVTRENVDVFLKSA